MGLASAPAYKYSHTIFRTGYRPSLLLNDFYRVDFTLDDRDGFLISRDQPWWNTRSYVSRCLRVFHVGMFHSNRLLSDTNGWPIQAVRRDLPTDFHLLSLAESEDRHLAIVESSKFRHPAST